MHIRKRIGIALVADTVRVVTLARAGEAAIMEAEQGSSEGVSSITGGMMEPYSSLIIDRTLHGQSGIC